MKSRESESGRAAFATDCALTSRVVLEYAPIQGSTPLDRSARPDVPDLLDLSDGSRGQRPNLSEHLDACPSCASRLAGELAAEELATRGAAHPIDDPAGRHGVTSTRSLAGRSLVVASRVPADAFTRLRDCIERVLALRAVRCVGGTVDDARKSRESLAAEHVAADEAVALLQAATADGAADAATIAEIERLVSWLAAFDESAASYEQLRRAGLVVPRPPELPRVGDWPRRAHVLAWASTILRCASTA